MTLLNWAVSTLSSTAVLVILAYLLRSIIETRLRASVQHEFNEKLEKLRTDLRNSEEAFKTDLRAKEREIEALRSGALSGLVSRQAILDKRRLEVVEQLWVAIEKLAPLKMPASMMATVDFEKALNFAAEESKVREFFATLGKSCEPNSLEKTDAHRSRPFVSEMAWALFSAYQAILYLPLVQLQMLKAGIKDPGILDATHVPKLTKAALPAYSEYIDKYGSSGCYYLIETLQAELLKELRRIMSGEESDKASVEQAARIMKEVEEVNKQSQSAQLSSGEVNKAIQKAAVPRPSA